MDRLQFAARNLEKFCAAIQRLPDPMLVDLATHGGQPTALNTNCTVLAFCDFIIGEADVEQLQGWNFPRQFNLRNFRGWQLPSADYLAELPGSVLHSSPDR